MKLLMSVLGVAVSLPLWANQPATQAAAPAPGPAAPVAPVEPAAPVVAQPTPAVVPAPMAKAVSTLPPEVKEEIILNNPSNLQALKTLLGPELSQAGAAQAAATPPAGARATGVTRVATQSTAMSAGRQQVQVRPGETLDRILARALGATPFAPALVRKTVVDMNPTAFAGGSAHRLNAGATLVLPSLQDLQAVAMGATSPGAATTQGSANRGPAHSADDRRNWIRYP